MKRSASPNLPLHYSPVPIGLVERMSILDLPIAETIASAFSALAVGATDANPFRIPNTNFDAFNTKRTKPNL